MAFAMMTTRIVCVSPTCNPTEAQVHDHTENGKNGRRVNAKKCTQIAFWSLLQVSPLLTGSTQYRRSRHTDQFRHKKRHSK